MSNYLGHLDFIDWQELITVIPSRDLFVNLTMVIKKK